MALDNQRRCLLQNRHQNARVWDKLSPATSGGGGEEASKSSTGGKGEKKKKIKNCCFSRVSSVERYLSAFENEMQERKIWQHFSESDSSWGFYPPHPPSALHPSSSSPGGGTSTWLQTTRCLWQSTSTSFNMRCNKLNPPTGGEGRGGLWKERRRRRQLKSRDSRLKASGINSNCCCKSEM